MRREAGNDACPTGSGFAGLRDRDRDREHGGTDAVLALASLSVSVTKMLRDSLFREFRFQRSSSRSAAAELRNAIWLAMACTPSPNLRYGMASAQDRRFAS